MRRLVCTFGKAALVAGTASMLAAQGQGQDHAPIQIPDSRVERPAERGIAAHTNHLIRVGPNAVGSAPRGETPSSIASVYSLTNLQASGAGVIVIVDAYHYPTALNDFNVFANQFGLPREGLDRSAQRQQSGVSRGLREWKQAAQQLRLGAGSGARHRVGARNGAERQDRAGRSGEQQFRGSVPGRRRRERDRQRARGVDELGGSEFSSEASNDGHFTHQGIVYFAAERRYRAAPPSIRGFPERGSRGRHADQSQRSGRLRE